MASANQHSFETAIASFLIQLRDVGKATTPFILRGIFLYAINLPLAGLIAEKQHLAIGAALGWCMRPLLKEMSEKSMREAFDIAVPCVVSLSLLFWVHQGDSPDDRMFFVRLMNQLESSNTVRIIWAIFVFAVFFSETARSIIVGTWYGLTGAVASKTRIFGLFIEEVLFDYEWFIKEVSWKCFVNFVEYFFYYSLFGGFCKLIWGYHAVPWVNLRWYKLQMFFMVIRNIQDKWSLFERMRNRRADRTTVPSDTPRYAYERLPPGHIRLLLLHARHTDEPIRCSLISTPLDNASKYEAMSYTWGPPGGERDILVDGKAFAVRPNAFNLLRGRSSYIFPRLLWVDAICINQTDIEERSQQVRLMDRIYRSASLGTIWISSENAMRNDVERFKDAVNARVAFELVQILRPIASALGEDKEKVYRRLASTRRTPMWEPLMNLLDNPWFERVWIVQEVLLSKSARILYEGMEMEWEDFADGLCVLREYSPALAEWTDAILVRTTLRPIKLANIGDIDRWRGSYERRGPIPFADIINATRGFQATDQRDKVYGVHGFCTRASEPWTLPDYSKSLAEVYFNAALRICHEASIPRCMSMAGLGYFEVCTSGLESNPSWVPDLSRRIGTANLSYWNEKLDYAAGGPPDPAVHRTNGRSLVLSASVLDNISHLAPSHGFMWGELLQTISWDRIEVA